MVTARGVTEHHKVKRFSCRRRGPGDILIRLVHHGVTFGMLARDVGNLVDNVVDEQLKSRLLLAALRSWSARGLLVSLYAKGEDIVESVENRQNVSVAAQFKATTPRKGGGR